MYNEANVSVNRNRIKTYPGNSVYLKNGQEFEIELFNPSTVTRLAKISINGKSISNHGLVLKPGQRTYLERYIDAPVKFKYETYEVNGSDTAAMAAIARNGDIEVSFYDEYVPIDYSVFHSSLTLTTTYPYTFTTSGGTGSVTCSSGTNTSLFTTTSTSGIGGQIVDSFSSTENEDYITKRDRKRSLLKGTPTKETGRIEQGTASNQGFTQYHGSFNPYTTKVVKIKILPFSEKPLEAQDLANYCTSCGAKNKGNKFKFCPSCGSKY